jgi:hypothetical protein
MASFRWTLHALHDLQAREIPSDEVGRTIEQPEATARGADGRMVLMRRYQDAVLGQEMLLRVVVEYDEDVVVIVTAYKTSRVSKYLGSRP